MKFRAIVTLLTSTFLITACSQDNAGPPPAPGNVEVGYVVLNSKPVQQSMDLRGRVAASATAEVRPQVNGIIRKVAFSEGREVEAGDILYEVDDAKFRAAKASAEAALKKASAATSSAQSTFERNQTLVKTQAVSTQVLEDAQSTLLQAQADEEAAKAEVETARINLENATIRAPIGGMIGLSKVSVGALVTENQTDALATIRQINPAYVDLIDTSLNMLNIREQVDSGRLSRQHDLPMSATLTLENGKIYAPEGKVSLADMVVGETTGTFTVRATFPNDDRVLVPGMFVTASLELGTMSSAFLVPQRAVMRGDDGKATVYLVSSDNKAELREITTAGSKGNDWIVTDGVEAGDHLIVDGFQKISSGISVTAVEASIDEDGVVKQALKVEDAQ